MFNQPSSLIAAFSEDQVQRLTNLSKRQLRYWDQTNFFAPAFADDETGPYRRFYSFRDVVGLRTIGVLLNQHKVTLQHLRKVAEALSHLAANLWTETKLFVHDRKVVIVEPGTDLPREVVSGQYVMSIALKSVIEDTTRAVKKLNQRPAATRGKLSQDRNVVHNQWVVSGTRIPISSIREFADAGYTVAQIMAEYPDLKATDIRAALAHTSKGRVAA